MRPMIPGPCPLPSLVALWMLLASRLPSSQAKFNGRVGWIRPSSTFRPRRSLVLSHWRRGPSFPLDLRGGATTTTETETTTDQTENNNDDDEKDSEEARDLRAYRWQQHLYLQSRGMQLRQALLARGLDGLHHSPQALEESKKHVPVDWDCALATEEHPKSCLYSFDAEPGTKVVAPRDTTQWISLTALNRLRRSDATKVEPLWHSQYSILNTWLNAADGSYSMYPYLTPPAALLSFLLDTPAVLMGGMALAVLTVFLVTLPFWESLLTTFLTSSLLWLQWPNWGRFIHAALPLKLLLGQMTWKFIALGVSKAYGSLRQRLVEWECQLWEECMPLTILEGKMKEEAEAAAAVAAAAATVTQSEIDLQFDNLEEDDGDKEGEGDSMDNLEDDEDGDMADTDNDFSDMEDDNDDDEEELDEYDLEEDLGDLSEED